MKDLIIGKKLLKIGAVTTIVLFVVIGVTLFSLSSGPDKKNDVNFNFDSDIYTSLEKDKIPISEIVKNKKEFVGKKPNIVMIYADDMGYGDLGSYGSKAIKTPNLDRLANEGTRFTDCYAAASLCSPSRASLLTGRYPHRTGVTMPIPNGDDTFVRSMVIRAGLFLGNMGIVDMRGGKSIVKGMPRHEVTIPEALKVAGYRSACIGKWHLGDFVVDERFLPRKHGFDYFLGINGANDSFPVALWRNETELKKDIGIDQGPITSMFTQEAVAFIERSREEPFFLFLSHKDPHLPNIPSQKFKSTSEAGPYGDTVEELDHSVGEIIKCLKRNGLDENTIVVFTSDNGPWYDGSPGNHRGRKGQSFEGGYRVPMIARWPKKIPAGKVNNTPCMSIDFFPTFLGLAGLDLPLDRIIDGQNIWGLISGRQAETQPNPLFFFHHNELESVRMGNWKYFRYMNTYTWPVALDKPNTLIGTLAGGRDYKPEGSDESISVMATWPVLYNMELDEGENYNVIKKYPEIAKKLESILNNFETDFLENPRGWL